MCLQVCLSSATWALVVTCSVVSLSLDSVDSILPDSTSEQAIYIFCALVKLRSFLSKIYPSFHIFRYSADLRYSAELACAANIGFAWHPRCPIPVATFLRLVILQLVLNFVANSGPLPGYRARRSENQLTVALKAFEQPLRQCITLLWLSLAGH